MGNVIRFEARFARAGASDPARVRHERALGLLTWAVRSGDAETVRRAVACIRAMRALEDRAGGAA